MSSNSWRRIIRGKIEPTLAIDLRQGGLDIVRQLNYSLLDSLLPEVDVDLESLLDLGRLVPLRVSELLQILLDTLDLCRQTLKVKHAWLLFTVCGLGRHPRLPPNPGWVGRVADAAHAPDLPLDRALGGVDAHRAPRLHGARGLKSIGSQLPDLHVHRVTG